jgi:DNA-binding Lrp family transcriptional regulator
VPCEVGPKTDGSSVKKTTINPKLGIDQTDIDLLSALQENSHQSCRKLAKKVDVSSPVASERIKILENKGLLKGYTAILDPAKLGYDLTVIIFIQAEANYVKDLANELSQMTNVITVYEVTGEFDIAAVVKLRGRESLNVLIKDLMVTPHIKKITTDIALNVVKEDFKVVL